MPTLSSTTRLPTANIMVSSWLIRLTRRTPMIKKKIRQRIITLPEMISNKRAFLWPSSVSSLNSEVVLRKWLLAEAADSADLVAKSAESSTIWAKDWYCW